MSDIIELKKRKYLIICRAGDNSLHREWVKDENRNFDLLIEYYGDQEGLYSQESEYYSANKGIKWSSLYELINDNREILLDYEAIWIPDDDISTTTKNINGLFEKFSQNDLWLAQPALTENSYFSHVITVENKLMDLRFTNFVEVMVPIFSSRSLEKCLLTFKDNPLGWGLDFVWPALLNYPKNKIAIIDSYPVTHTRPAGTGEIYNNIIENPHMSLQRLIKEYNIVHPMEYVVYNAHYKEILKDKDESSNLQLLKNLIQGSSRLITDRSNSFIKEYIYPTLLDQLNLDHHRQFEDLIWNIEKDDLDKASSKLIDFVEANDLSQNDIINIVKRISINKQEVYNIIAIKAYQKKLIDIALFLLEESLKLDINHVNTNFNLGCIYYNQNEKSKALKYLQNIQAVDNDVDDFIRKISLEL
ncbi:hypothetical protein QCD85_22755 [Paenibacillus sp. PsM32]|uniref:tetratricopeptide repeat protein n=1 Tax=Paenibacillus sp. PsM32 TaxID=3030536 RepID=UPI00263AE047|nr:hypothetical protein [Paenibacillus sp. PsM32]MDN4620955.1 hypothetical protein [Paenibacillus sp. PsM32]